MDRDARDYPPGDFRVSDAERDQALSELSKAFQVGRITADEFDQRSAHVLSARTGKELTAPLADLPPDRAPAPRAPAARATDPERAHRVLAIRTFAAGVAATCFAAVSVANALNGGPSAQQRQYLQQMMARMGHPGPLPPAAGFDWPGTITPGVIAVMLVVLIIILRRNSTGPADHKPSWAVSVV
jgi:hypothetical protein